LSAVSKGRMFFNNQCDYSPNLIIWRIYYFGNEKQTPPSQSLGFIRVNPVRSSFADSPLPPARYLQPISLYYIHRRIRAHLASFLTLIYFTFNQRSRSFNTFAEDHTFQTCQQQLLIPMPPPSLSWTILSGPCSLASSSPAHCGVSPAARHSCTSGGTSTLNGDHDSGAHC
jgi:hypothetical protein